MYGWLLLNSTYLPTDKEQKGKIYSKAIFKIPGLEKEIIQVTTILPFFHCQLFYQWFQAREITPAVSVIWPWNSVPNSILSPLLLSPPKWGNLTHLSYSGPRPSERPRISPCLLYLCLIPWHLPPCQHSASAISPFSTYHPVNFNCHCTFLLWYYIVRPIKGIRYMFLNRHKSIIQRLSL